MEKLFTTNQEDTDKFLQDCRTKVVIRDKVEKCLVSKHSICKHSFYFGTEIFCKHPLRDKIPKHNHEETFSQQVIKSNPIADKK